jgi:hypothetical protein
MEDIKEFEEYCKHYNKKHTFLEYVFYHWVKNIPNRFCKLENNRIISL